MHRWINILNGEKFYPKTLHNIAFMRTDQILWVTVLDKKISSKSLTDFLEHAPEDMKKAQAIMMRLLLAMVD